MHLELRKCNPSEVKCLADISRKTFSEAFEKYNNPEDFKNYLTYAFAESTLLEQLNNADSFFYFLYADKELAGYFKINIGEAQSEIQDESSIELERIYVVSNFQGQGYGAYMLEEAIAFAKRQEKKRLWLGVWEENPDAIRFYEKNGFAKFGTHPYYVGKDKQTDWLMRIEI